MEYILKEYQGIHQMDGQKQPPVSFHFRDYVLLDILKY